MKRSATALVGALLSVLWGATTVNVAAEAAVADNGTSSTTAVAAAPGFSEKDIFGRDTIDLRRYKGKVVLLNFWATWCPPCREEIPALKLLQDAHRKDLVVIGVSVFCSNADTELFYTEYTINYPMIYGSFDLMGKYGKVDTIPTTFLITKDGRLSQRVVGSRTQAEYEAMLTPLLAQ